MITRAFSEDPDLFIIGDRVWVQGIKPGYIQFIGEVQFAKGDWAGIVLDKPEGKNDGSVHGGKWKRAKVPQYKQHHLSNKNYSSRLLIWLDESAIVLWLLENYPVSLITTIHGEPITRRAAHPFAQHWFRFCRHIFANRKKSFVVVCCNLSSHTHTVRYFQCEPNRGLFTRLHRLSRYPLDLNGNPLPADDGLIRTRRVRTPDGQITTTVTRVTKGPVATIPHYALPARPSKVITTVTTTTTTTMNKPKSVLKSSCRITSSKSPTTHRVHF